MSPLYSIHHIRHKEKEKQEEMLRKAPPIRVKTRYAAAVASSVFVEISLHQKTMRPTQIQSRRKEIFIHVKNAKIHQAVIKIWSYKGNTKKRVNKTNT